jgi:hypothetical protein
MVSKGSGVPERTLELQKGLQSDGKDRGGRK